MRRQLQNWALGGISPCHCRIWGRLRQHWQAPGKEVVVRIWIENAYSKQAHTCMTKSWHLLMNCDSVWTMVWRNLRYCTCFPWLSMQWTKCWTTFSFTSLHNTALSWYGLMLTTADQWPGSIYWSQCWQSISHLKDCTHSLRVEQVRV